MCDYSLHTQKTRKAEVGDKLVVSGFKHTNTKGMRRPIDEDIDTATCMLPGTEVAFAVPPAVNDQPYAFMYGAAKRKVIDSQVARFRQLDRELPCRHHDALEFANGDIVLVNDLVEDQKLTVLQLGCEVPVAEPAKSDELVVGPGFAAAVSAGMGQLVPNLNALDFANNFQGLTSSEGERTDELVAGSAPVK